MTSVIQSTTTAQAAKGTLRRGGSGGRVALGRPGRKWLLRGLTLLVASLTALLLAEIGLRWCVLQEGKRLATYDPLLGWRGRPHGTEVYARKSDNIAVTFTYNELGFRDQAVLPKPAHGKRLMLLGDSFVESLEVDYPLTFGAQLEQLLRSRDRAWDVCVIGSQGYSTAQELLAFGRYQAVVQGDWVLLCFYCGNDFEDNQRSRFAYLDEQGELVLPQDSDPMWKHVAQYTQRWLYESSHVVYLLKNSLEKFSNLHLGPASKAEVAASEDYPRNITRQLIDRLQQEVHQTGGRLAMVIIPARDDLQAGNYDKPTFVKDLCESLQIPHVDLTAHLAPEHFFNIDLHFNERGHAVAARAIDAFICTELLSITDNTYSPADRDHLSLGD